MNATVAPAVMPAVDQQERGHRWRVYIGYSVAIALVLALAIYGFDYYMLDAVHRPLSAKHAALKPSGTIGLKLGMFGTLLFFGIFLYPLRKHWEWLGNKGNSRHWLDIHVLMGLAAPFIIAFHASFKFQGFAGMAFWIMAAVSLSGIIGRYVYGQIPRSLNLAEVSLSELGELHQRLGEMLRAQRLLPAGDLRSLMRLPSPDKVARMPLVVSIAYMIALDMARPFRVARLRRHSLGFGGKLMTLGGMLHTHEAHLEEAIDAASAQAALSKRILFLSRAKNIFHLWHVVHRPFSYSFAVLAIIHIAVVTMLGFVWW